MKFELGRLASQREICIVSYLEGKGGIVPEKELIDVAKRMSAGYSEYAIKVSIEDLERQNIIYRTKCEGFMLK